MSLITALENIAMVCEVLNLPHPHASGSSTWQCTVDDCPLELEYFENSDELVVTYELLGDLPHNLPLETVQRWARFAELHLRHKVGSVLLSPERRALLLVGKLAVGDGDACVLSLWLPLFLTACVAWRLGPPEVKSEALALLPHRAEAKRGLRHLALVNAEQVQ